MTTDENKPIPEQNKENIEKKENDIIEKTTDNSSATEHDKDEFLDFLSTKENTAPTEDTSASFTSSTIKTTPTEKTSSKLYDYDNEIFNLFFTEDERKLATSHNLGRETTRSDIAHLLSRYVAFSIENADENAASKIKKPPNRITTADGWLIIDFGNMIIGGPGEQGRLTKRPTEPSKNETTDTIERTFLTGPAKNTAEAIMALAHENQWSKIHVVELFRIGKCAVYDTMMIAATKTAMDLHLEIDVKLSANQRKHLDYIQKLFDKPTPTDIQSPT